MITRLRLAALLVAGLAGCGHPSAPSEEGAPVAMVGDAAISAGLFDRYVERKTGAVPSKADPALRRRLLEDLIALKAAGAAGSHLGIPAVDQDAKLARLEVLAHAAADAGGVYAIASEAELQSAHQTYVASRRGKEFHVAHILVATEALALGTIRELHGGRDFSAMARARSADDSKERGGDLGWIAPGHLPKEFTNAVSTLAPGEYTHLPVMTIYGWHVIKLIESRAANVPPFEQVKAQIVVNLQQARYDEFLKSVVAKTAVERTALTVGAR